MAFKQNPDKKPRWEELSKAALIKTVRTLSARQTKLLNQIAKLERRPAPGAALDVAAVEFGYRAGEKGADNLEMTLARWINPSGVQLDGILERNASKLPDTKVHKLPWEE